MDELDAAGIRDASLRASYERCKRLNAQHGKTYYLATLLLPPEKRPYVHALYGFARYADEIVDDLSSTLSGTEKAEWLGRWGDDILGDLRSGRSHDPVGRALVDTALTWQIPLEHFEAFLHSMRMDLTVTEYENYEALFEYVYGSAAVIGLQMVPILEPSSPEAYPRAMDLGVAFQLANFIRDVGEDLDRGRVYLPLDELARHGVDRETLERRIVTPEVRAALAEQVARVRMLEERSRPGIALLSPDAQPCIDAARVLYCGIVDEVERNDYEVFQRRARVPLRRRLAVAGPAWVRARLARRRTAARGGDSGSGR
ncbi:MAG: phytoene/squalene synthase family protein [bacterium]